MSVLAGIGTHATCPGCSAVLPIIVHPCPRCNHTTFNLTFDAFFKHLDNMQIMDARHGGLVLGRDGPEDDIPMFMYAGRGIFMMYGAMQGGEYILSQAASAKHGEQLVRLNSEIGEVVTCNSSKVTSIINTNLLPPSGAIWVRDRQFIVNRFATAKYLDTIDALNADARSKTVQEWSEDGQTATLNIDDFRR